MAHVNEGSQFYLPPHIYSQVEWTTSFSLLSHHTIESLGYLVYCVFCTVADFSQRKKIAAQNLAYLFDYYLDRSSPILVNFGSRGVTAVALLPGYTNRTWETNVYKSHLQKKFHGEARWAVGIGAARRVRLYGAICILQACWCICFFMFLVLCSRQSWLSIKLLLSCHMCKKYGEMVLKKTRILVLFSHERMHRPRTHGNRKPPAQRTNLGLCAMWPLKYCKASGNQLLQVYLETGH